MQTSEDEDVGRCDRLDREFEGKRLKMRWKRFLETTVLILAGLAPTATVAEAWKVDVWTPPFTHDRPSQTVTYQPLDRAAKPWKLCISYPHLKDAYWLSVNYGMVAEAHRLGVAFRLLEAGGYPKLKHQRVQIKDCLAQGADALIVGTVSYGGLSDLMEEVARDMPVIASVNDISNEGIAAKVGVSWVEMGRVTGAYLAKRHPKGTPGARVALFPGPTKPEWVGFVLDGFRDGIAGSAIEVVVTKRGDTGKEIQRTLVEEALEEVPDIDYIVGTSVTAEAAVSQLAMVSPKTTTQIVSFYMTHGVYRGIKRGKILAAPTDRPALQGRMSIEQAVRVLDGRVLYSHLGPAITMVDGGNIENLDIHQSLAPASFIPVFEAP